MENKLSKPDVDRINYLAAEAKKRTLTPAELEEQKNLREAYIAWFRAELLGK